MTEKALKVGCIYTWELTKGQYKKVFTDQHQIEKKKKVDIFCHVWVTTSAKQEQKREV